MAKKFKAGQIINSAKAFGGGLAAGAVIDVLDNNEKLADNPMMAPLIVAGLGTVGEMFLGPKLHDVCMGIVGGAGANMWPTVREKVFKLDEFGQPIQGDTATINAAQKQRAQNIMAAVARRNMKPAGYVPGRSVGGSVGSRIIERRPRPGGAIDTTNAVRPGMNTGRVGMAVNPYPVTVFPRSAAMEC